MKRLHMHLHLDLLHLSPTFHVPHTCLDVRLDLIYSNCRCAVLGWSYPIPKLVNCCSDVKPWLAGLVAPCVGSTMERWPMPAPGRGLPCSLLKTNPGRGSCSFCVLLYPKCKHEKTQGSTLCWWANFQILPWFLTMKQCKMLLCRVRLLCLRIGCGSLSKAGCSRSHLSSTRFYWWQYSCSV